MKLVRLAYRDINAVFELEVTSVEIQSIVSFVLEEVATLSRFSPSYIAFLRGAISSIELCIEFSITVVLSTDVAVYKGSDECKYISILYV